MAERTIKFVEGEYYHLYNRGNSKQTIFQDVSDHRRFLRLMYLANSNLQFKLQFIENQDTYNVDRETLLVDIGVYCLMHNHFHLILTPLIPNGVSKFMQKLSTGYSMYYNNKYQRTGTLFEGRYKAEHASEDRYLKYLFSYVHLNPVKQLEPEWREKGIHNSERAFNHVAKYPFSSLSDYLGNNREEKAIITPSMFEGYFTTSDSIKSELFEWISYRSGL